MAKVIKLTPALLQGEDDSHTNSKRYQAMAHRLFYTQLRKAGKLPPAADLHRPVE